MNKISVLINIDVTVADIYAAGEVALLLKETLDNNDIPNKITIINET